MAQGSLVQSRSFLQVEPEFPDDVVELRPEKPKTKAALARPVKQLAIRRTLVCDVAIHESHEYLPMG